MIAAANGRRETPSDIAARSDCRGSALDRLVAIADELQLEPRPVRLELDELRGLRLPAVLHWRMNHFVVLVAVRRRSAIIHDPAAGRLVVDWRTLDESFTGVAVEFAGERRMVRRPGNASLTFADFLRSFDGIGRYLALLIGLLVAAQLLAVVPAVVIQLLIDQVSPGDDRDWLYRSLFGLLVIMLLTVLLDGFRQWATLATGIRLAADNTAMVVGHLFKLPSGWVADRHLGDVMSRIESLAPVRNMITDQAASLLVQSVVFISTAVVMWLYSPRLALVVIAGTLVSTAIITVTLPRVRGLSEQHLASLAAEKSSLLESLKGFATLRALGLAGDRRRHWQDAYAEVAANRLQAGRLNIGRGIAIGMAGAVEQVAFYAVGITAVVDRELTLGVLFAFVALRGRMAGAATMLQRLVEQLAVTRVHLDRVAEIVAAEPEPQSPRGAPRTVLRGDLEGRGLAVGFIPGAPLVAGLSLQVHAGSHAVIVGPSGCGKTTLLRVLSRQLSPLAGAVLIDGIEADLWDRAGLQAQSATVMQDDRLFAGTLLENVTAFGSSPDIARVRAACVAAMIWDEVAALPMGLDTLLGDTACGLSGGQAQRIMIARALYRRPRLLFLDEATSQLDEATETAVLRNIATAGMTVISVSHRPAAVRLADQVIDLGATTGTPSRPAVAG